MKINDSGQRFDGMDKNKPAHTKEIISKDPDNEPMEIVDIENSKRLGRKKIKDVIEDNSNISASVSKKTMTHFEAGSTGIVRRPVPPEPPAFPQDEGAHPGVKTEWWYVNGHLEDDTGRKYGFHDALFDTPNAIWGRYNVEIPGMPGATQLDTAFLDLDAKTHIESRKLRFHMPGTEHDGLTKGRLDCSFSSSLGEWSLKRIDEKTIEFQKPLPDGELKMKLYESKPPIMMGGEGEILMGPKGLSKYYTHSQLKAEGSITRSGETHKIKGSVWMDHQWGDMSMYDPWRGWDWFGIQLDGGTQLNMFHFRNEDGSSLQTTVGISRPDGSQEHLDDFKITPGAVWNSPETEAAYPLEWILEIPSKQAKFYVKPLMKEQEIPGTWPYTDRDLAIVPTYWEGACDITGNFEGKPVKGKAYVELVGYEEQRGDMESAIKKLNMQVVGSLTDSRRNPRA